MRRFILGTDWYTDCDDAVALRLLARFHLAKEIELCGIYANTCNAPTPPSLYNFSRHEGLDVPIGVDYEATSFTQKVRYQQRLAEGCTKTDFPDAVKLCRQLLAQAPADFIEIGFQTVLERLLKSEPDEISPLTGKQLLEGSTLWTMAGKWPEGCEHNINLTWQSREAADFVARNWEGKIIYCGFECAEDVITGANFPQDDILKQIFTDYGCKNGRPSWDPLTALVAVSESPEALGFHQVRGTAEIDVISGDNSFTENENGLHSYLVREKASEWYANQINLLVDG